MIMMPLENPQTQDASATGEDRGLLLVLTGHGKGKSSAAFGMVARALGHGLQVGVVQFIKSREDTGEVRFFEPHPQVQWHVLGKGFSRRSQDPARDPQAAQAAWQCARGLLNNPTLGLVVLDELSYPLKYGWLETATVLAELRARPAMQHVILTGRAMPEAVCAAADTVTECYDHKHAWRSGIKAQKGLDW